MRNVLSIFRDFIELGLDRDSLTEYYNKRVGDSCLSKKSLIIIRTEKEERSIIYLTTGLTINIPEKWFNFFSQLNVHSGHQLGEGWKSPSTVEKAIMNLCDFFNKIDVTPGSTIRSDYEDYILSDLSLLNTRIPEIRKILEEFDLDLGPIVVLSKPDVEIQL